MAEMYSVDWLESQGQRFIKKLFECKGALEEHVAPRGAEMWTDLVLGWFSVCHSADMVIDRKKAGTPAQVWRKVQRHLDWTKDFGGPWSGEFMLVDLVASRAPSYRGRYWTGDYWNDYFKTVTPETAIPVMALECEWKAPRRGTDARFAYVMHSGMKLAHISAKTKVLVFATAGENDDESVDLAYRIEQLRALHHQNCPWLVIDIPYGPWTVIPPFSLILPAQPEPNRTEIKKRIEALRRGLLSAKHEWRA